MYMRSPYSGNWTSGSMYIPPADDMSGLALYDDVINVKYGMDGMPYYPKGEKPAFVNEWLRDQIYRKKHSKSPVERVEFKYTGLNDEADSSIYNQFNIGWSPVRDSNYMMEDLQFAYYATRQKSRHTKDRVEQQYAKEETEVAKYGRRTKDFSVTRDPPSHLLGAYIPPQRYRSELYRQYLWHVGKQGGIVIDAPRLEKALMDAK